MKNVTDETESNQEKRKKQFKGLKDELAKTILQQLEHKKEIKGLKNETEKLETSISEFQDQQIDNEEQQFRELNIETETLDRLKDELISEFQD